MSEATSTFFEGVPRAGRRFDAWLAREVLGHSVVQQKNGAWQEGTPEGVRPLKEFSKDIGAAWELVERLNITLIPVEGGQWFALAGQASRWQSPAEFLRVVSLGRFKEMGAAVGHDVAFTICLSAYQAIEARRSAPEAGATALV